MTISRTPFFIQSILLNTRTVLNPGLSSPARPAAHSARRRGVTLPSRPLPPPARSASLCSPTCLAWSARLSSPLTPLVCEPRSYRTATRRQSAASGAPSAGRRVEGQLLGAECGFYFYKYFFIYNLFFIAFLNNMHAIL